MTIAGELASFVCRSSYEDLSQEAVLQLKIRVLDALGCAIGAIGAPPTELVKMQIEDFGTGGSCSLIGGGHTSPDQAAFYNSALVRYLDFNDSYLAPKETCHPSDNLGAVLAGAEYAGVGGKDFLTALAVAYQVQCRLSDEAPVRSRGFDHTTQGSFAVAAGVSRALRLDHEQTANALSLCGTAFNALRVTRTGALSHWKGLAYPNTAFSCTHAVFLAMRGVTGPPEVFEGNKGFIETISGPFHIDWARENLERVTRTSVKKYNAEVHSQSAIEGTLELKAENGFMGGDLARLEIDTFDVAYNIIGGGEEGDRTVVETKEQADHSLPYVVAAAVLDGKVTPEQYKPERIMREDIQDLLRKVVVRPLQTHSARFPSEMPCTIRAFLKDGRVILKEKKDHEGYFTNPFGWGHIVEKFEGLTAGRLEASIRREIVDVARGIESVTATELARLLGRIDRRGW